MSDKLKFEDLADIGDIIRAYDFQPRDGVEDAYLIGQVVDKGWTERGDTLVYVVRVLNDVWGEGARNGQLVYVPYETTFDYDGRVQLVCAA